MADYFRNMKSENNLVHLRDSAEKLIRILTTNTYISGSHVGKIDTTAIHSASSLINTKYLCIDYYDDMETP